jgi:hydroxyethylthiazole kinase-like uncharacterized protein yjeF
LHERAAAQAAEAAALSQAAAFSLMARAGLGVARLARALAPHAQRVLVLVGPGNNGGDGLVAARCLHQAGLAVQVWLTTAPAKLPPDAARAWQEARSVGVELSMLVVGDADGEAGAGAGAETAASTLASGVPQACPDLLIDALLGLGARRAPEGLVGTAIARGRALAAQGVPVLAVDLPSGMHPDTGQPLGTLEQVLPATATLCLLTLRPGCFTGHGRDLAGQVWFDDLGCGTAANRAHDATATLSGAGWARPQLQATHKGNQGDVAVVGGAAGMVGAAWLAASAALAAGAGRVYLSLLDSAAMTLNVNRPELMLRPQLWAAPPPWLQQCTVVAGCGGGHDIATALPPLLAHAGRLVLDADALNAVAADTALQTQLQHRTARGLPTVLTPHPLEAARLLGLSTAAVQADRLASARQLAQRFGAVVVLKGSGSVVASPSGQTSINPTGNASLATAGTGDVLAGWLGGRWAQAAAGQSADQLHALVAAGVWQHGAAADRHRASGRTGPLLAAELVAALLSASDGDPGAAAGAGVR